MCAQAEQAQLEADIEAAEAEDAAAKRAEWQKKLRGLQAERYVTARREQLKLEVRHRMSPLPPLCSCGLDPLDNHPDNCARNCVFYRNPEAYKRALSGLFVRPISLGTK